MNKIFKVIYSKTRHCYVVVSELAKSHCKTAGSHTARNKTALTAAVLLALGTFSVASVFMPMPAEAADKTKTDGSNFVGVERTDGLLDDNKYDNYGGKGANGADSITLGLNAQAGAGTITIGDRNAGASLGSVYVGQGDIAKPKLDTGGWATSIGYNSDATGYGSIALGSNAVAKNSYAKDSKGESLELNQTYVDNGVTKVRLNSKPDIQRASVAIGYGASADNGNIAIGSYSDASTDLRTAKTTDGKEIKSYLTDTKADSYVSVGKSDALRRISNVADGAADSDVATVSQLRKAVEATDASKKANIDASNIGKNLKYKADGKTAAESSDITTNEDAWGTAIGTGKVEDKNGQLVTGGTVYNAIQDKAAWKLTTNGEAADKSATIKPGTTVDFSADKNTKNHSNVTISHDGSNVTIGLDKDVVLGEASKGKGGSLNVYSDSSDANNLSNHVSITGSTISVNYPKIGTDGKTTTDTRGVILGVGEDSQGGADGYIAFNNAGGNYTYLHSATDAPEDLQNRLEYVGNDRQKKYIANLDDGITFKTDSIKGHIGSDSIPMKLNQTYTFSGDFGEGKTTDDLSNGNIAVVAQHSIKMPVGGGTATVTDDGFTVKLAKDLKGITSIGNQTTKKDGNKEVTTGARIVLNDNGTTTISGGNVNVSNHKVTGLADGTEKTDAVTVQQLTAVKNDTTDGLANKANVDASNIGANLKGSNGTSAAPAEQITLNENAWGKALGTGSVTTQNGQLVTGGTVFNALQNQKNDLTDKLSVNAGWGINIDKTKGNTISLERNLGTNNGNTNKGTGKVTFEANGTNSLILGGQADTFNNNNVKAGTDGQYSVLVGGRNNYIDSKGTSAVIAGGFRNSASGIESAVFGGGENAASGPNSAVLGGSFNKASGEYSTVIGGGDRFDNYGGNHAEGTLSTIIGGYHNDTWSGSENSVIVGGRSNSTYYTDSVIVGGGYNVTYTSNANVFGGYGNWAGNNTTISGGVENITLAYQAYALSGYANQVSGYLATSLGGQNQKVIGNYSTAIGGASTGRTAENATAIGSQAVVTAKNGLALGYKATADKEGTISFGHDKGDISGYDSKIKLEDGSYSLSDIQKYLVGATSGEDNRDVIYTPTYYESAEYNRLVKVSDGKDAHDAVVMEQLTPYTKSDASNIGSNLKTYTVGDDGETITETDATEEQQKANKDAWGKALGADTFSTGTDATPTNASTSDQLVTGKTLYDYDKPTDSQNYVKVNNTTGQNLSALDAQVKANADELNKPNHNIKYYSVNETAPLMNSDAYKNDGNDGAKGEGSLAAGFVTHADGIASTVAGSYSGVINSGKAQGLDLRGAAALSYGTFNVNQNTDAAKDYSGVANSIVGQANMTKDSNAAIIYGAGNIVTDSYRPIDEKKAAAILGSVNDPAKLGEAMKDAVETSGGQVMVMGGGNSVDKAYMTQVTGVGNKVSGQDSTYAEGTSTQYNFVDGFQNELTNGKHDYIIGTKNKVSGDSVDKNQSNIIFGDNHTLTNTKNAVIIGSSDKVTEMAGSDAVSIGYNANAGGESVALGSNAVAGGNALAVGPYANAKNNSIALGIHASATSSQNLAIGYYANVTGRPDTIKNSVALGASSTVGEKDILSTDNGNGILSIGAKDKERRIIHVRAGVNDTDAVNVSQLKSAQNDLTGKGLKFAANSGDVYTAKLGSTVKIQGTDKKADHEYTADNLTTEIDKNGNITILMDKDMSVEKLAVNGKDGKDGKPGTAGSIGISGQDGKAGVGIDGKDGISIKGKDGKDGVTMKAVDGKNGTEGHIGLTGPAGTNGKDGTNAIDITVKNGYDGANGINGKNGVDGTSLTRIVYTDKTGEHQVATMEDGLKFKGDDTTVINKKLNNTLEIIGGAKGDLTENNIGVNSTKEGKLKVQLSKNLTGMNSTTYTTTTGEGESATISTTVVNGNGLTITNGPSITNKGVDGGNKVITNVGSGIEQDANGKYTVTDQNKGNAANVGDVQNMVNDAKTELTDGANGLNKKANIDASNIGANLKGADGKTPASDAEKTANKDAWGKAIGTDKIEANNGQLVTSKAVYDEVRPKEDGNYVKKDKTTGENLSALDSKIGKLDKDGNYIKKDDSISKNLSTLDTQVKNNADAIQNITNNVKNLSDNAVQYDKDSNKSKVTLAGKDGTTITNVKDGSVAKDSKDAVNGGQLYEVNEKVTNNTNEITKIENGEGFTDAGKTVIKNLSKDAVQVKAGDRIKVDEATDEKTGNKTYTISANNNGTVAKGDDNLISGNTLYKEVHVDNDGSYIKGSNTVGQNLSALDTGLKTTSDLIHTNDKGDTIQIGGNSTATKIDVNGKDGKGRVITGVVTDAGDPNSAANVGYVNGLTAANTQQIYRDMSNAYSRLDTNINRAAAGSNALAALHPLDFDPADKASFAVGYGHYHNANAAAVGAFYQPNANTMVNMGISLGNGDPGFNAGVSFKIGKGSAYNGVSKAEMAQTIHDQAAEISTIKANDAAKDKRIDALEKENQEMKKQIQEILARLNG